MDSQTDFILTLSCADKPGIVFAVSGFLVEQNCNIVDSQQHRDPQTGQFFMRVSFAAPRPRPAADSISGAFRPIASRFAMTWRIYDAAVPPRMAILVSKFQHCLNDLLYRVEIGALPVTVPVIVSNHPDAAPRAASHGIRFEHLPVTQATKAEQEAKLTTLLAEEKIELVVLARYMQVLSPELCGKLEGNVINIHHSFLPSFRGAKPYGQAYARGVKLIGATAHYVTADLDEGPIIEQDVARVDHADGPQDLVHIGRDVECLVLARAVSLHVERRVLLNGMKTVVFR
ncbi:MAG TPA: formyltetrahydrofolate deformylase [Alphaproteobacteria bacterium]|nr:formyltetrahydrofolate deformylase [Alphaproteobacteria bacterium]